MKTSQRSIERAGGPVGVTAAPFMRSGPAAALDLALRAERMGYGSGFGVSSPVVASDWHGAAYPGKPLAQMREFLVVLRECLSGEPVTFAGDFYQLRKFRLGVDLPARRPKVIVGALGEGSIGADTDVISAAVTNRFGSSVKWSALQSGFSRRKWR